MNEALDNLGRKVNSTNMSVGELKGLIGTLMKSKVGPAKPISSFVEKSNEGTREDPDLKPLVESFEKYIKGHTEEVEEHKSLIEDIKSLISEINKSRASSAESAKEEKEPKEKSSFAEKAVESLRSIFKKDAKQGEVISDSTEGLYKVFSKKGSGFTHDIHCEFWLKTIHSVLTKIADHLKVPDVKKTEDEAAERAKNPSPIEKEAEAAIRDNYKQQAGLAHSIENISTFSDNDFQYDQTMSATSINSYADAMDFFMNIGKAFKGELTKRQKKEYALSVGTENVVEELRSLYQRQAEAYTKETGNSMPLSVFLDSNPEAREAKDSLKKKGVWQHQQLDSAPEQEQIKSILKEQARIMYNQGRIQRRNTAASEENLRIQLETLKKLEDMVFGFQIIEKIFGGVIVKEREFVQEIRAAAYETAGVTKESIKLQKSFEDIGKSVYKTGVGRDEFQKAYIKGLKSGMKDQKKLNSLTVAQLNTEKQIGVEAGSLGEQFLEYGNAFKLNEDQISAVGRGIREVGRNSGVVGEKLQQAVESSKQFADQMRKAGTATAASITNVTGLKAEFNKLGVEGDKVITALSSSSGYFGADGETLTLVAQAAAHAGILAEAQAGVVMQSKRMQKAMTEGFKVTANRMGIAGETVDDMRKSLEGLSNYNKMALNLRLNAAYGVEAGELLNMIEGFENNSQTLSDKLKELNKQKAQNLTLEEKTTLLENERRLKLSASLGLITALGESAKTADSMGEALSNFSKKRRDFEEDISSLGISWTSEIDVARASLKSSISSLNEGLKAAGKRELSISTSEIEKALSDQTAFRELTAKLSTADQEIATAQKAQVDPLKSIDQRLMETNDTLRNISKNLISGAFSSLIGKLLVGTLALSTGFLSFRSQAQDLMRSSARFFNTLFPQKGAAGTQRDNSARPFQKAFMEGIDRIKSVLGIKEAVEDAPIKGVEAEVVAATAKAAEGAGLATGVASDLLIDVNKSMLAVLNRIAECVCGGVKSAAGSDFTPVVVEQGAKKEIKRRSFTPQERAERKAKAQEIKNIRMETRLNAMKKKTVVEEVKLSKMEVPKETGLNFKSLMSNGKEMAKTAAGVMILGVGVLALAAAVVFVSDKILKAFNLDLPTILNTAAAVGAVALAGGAIAAAGYGAYELLTGDTESNKFPKISELLSRDIASKIAAIALLGPALVLLGASIVKMSQMIVGAFGLDLSTVAETAGVVTAIVGSAGAITVAASEALKAFEELAENDLLKNPSKIRELLWEGAKAILIVGPGLVLLGAAVIKLSQMVLSLFNLDATTIATVSAKVAALIAGTAVIAGALAGGVVGLAGLGKLMDIAKNYTSEIAKGAAAMLLLAPPIVFLAAALNRIVGGILGITGVDAGKAAKVAYDVASLIASTSLISVAIIGAVGGLIGLGALATAILGPQIGFIFAGAAALFLITPAILMLSSALINMVKGIMSAGEVDASTAAKTAFHVAGVIGGAAAIAIAIMAAMAGLAGLGMLLPIAATSAWLMIGGATALYVLTPAVLSLASSIIQMSGAIAGTLVSQDEIKKVTEGVSSILGGAAQIAVSVLASVAGLSVLGLFFVSAMLAIPLMWLGTKAFEALITPITNFIGAVKEASNKIGSIVNPSQAKEMSEGVASVLESVSNTASTIASTASSLASFPRNGGFFRWLMGSRISDILDDGILSLSSIMSPIMRYMIAIKSFSRLLGATIDPRQAKPMADGVAAVLEACAKVTESISIAAEPLKKMSMYQGFFNWLGGRTVGDTVDSGIAALNNLAGPIKTYVEAIKKFSSEVGSILSPRMAAQMAVGVGDVLCSVGGVSQAILETKDGLTSVKSKEWGWFGTNYVKQMDSGAASLEKLSGPVSDYVSVVKKFSNRLGKRLNPRLAASMAKGVAEILSATGEVTKKVLETREDLGKIKTSTGWLWFRKNYVKRSKEGVKALKELSGPIIDYVDTIKNFSSEVGRKLDVRQAASMSRGVADILEASGNVTEKIVSTKDQLVKIKSSEGFWLWATDIPAAMRKGVVALNELKQPIIDYVSSIVDFSKEVGNKVKPGDAKSSAKALVMLSNVVSVFACVLEDLQNKITPMTQSGWFTDSPISQITEAKKKVEEFFPTLTQFVNSIVQNTKNAAGQEGGLKQAAKNLSSISQIFQSVGETTSVIKEKIIPITTGGWFASSDVDSIKDSIPRFNGFFEQISSFINNGLVAPISKIGDGSVLRESSKKIVGVAQLLRETAGSISSLQSVIDLTSDGFFSSSPMKNINSNKSKFAEYFSGISGFLNSGIVDPIKKMAGTDELVDAKAKLVDVGCFLYGLKFTLENLSGVFSLMESKSLFEKSPLEKIKTSKDDFAKYMKMAKDFILDGLLAPSMALPSAEIEIAAGNLGQAAKMTMSISPVIRGLVSAVSLATDKDEFFGETPMKKIVDSKVVFAEYFKQIANFIKEGIALPVSKEFAGVDLSGASKTMSSMANIASSIVPIIKNLSSVMGMMSGEAEDSLDTDFPIDKILSYKTKFADYFKKISIFLRDGIIAPIETIFPDGKALRGTSQILSSMVSIVSGVPKLILGISNGFVPLVDSGTNLQKEIPMQQIMNSKQQFADWFVEIAEFLRVGIVEPINGKIGDPKEIQKASRTLSAMSNVVSSVGSILTKLASVFGGLNERKCLSKSPAEVIASQTSKFSDWFYGVVGFLKLGIINPINELVPNEKEIRDSSSKLKTLAASMLSMPLIFNELGESISLFSNGPLWRMITGFKIGRLSKNFMSMANIITEGIIKPIQESLPDSKELAEVDDQLNKFIAIIEKISSTMGIAGKSISGLKPISLEQAISDPSEVKAIVEEKIKGKSEVAIEVAERKAEMAAMAELSKKTGRRDLSGANVDTEVDMEKGIVRAVAKWSEEEHKAAGGLRKSMEETGAAAGGVGRSAMPTPKTEIAMKSAGEAAAAPSAPKGAPYAKQKRSPIKVEGMDTYEFNDPEERNLAANLARDNAKAKILLAIKGIEGENYAIEPTVLKGIKYSSPKFEWNKENDEGVAKIIAEYNWGEGIPKLAKGGIVNKPTLGVVGEAGPEAVVPLSGIEKYSSGIIAGLSDVGSTLTKILKVLKSGSKQQGPTSNPNIVINQENSSIVEIGETALGTSIGVALAPAVSGVPKAFREGVNYMAHVFKEAINKLVPKLESESSSIFSYIESMGESAYSLMEPHTEKISSYAQSAFAPVGDYLSKGFEPLTKGFTRSMEAGEGIFKSLSRGVTSQYMSITRGKPISEVVSKSFNQLKENGIKSFEQIRSKVPESWKKNTNKALSSIKNSGSKAFSYMSSKVPQSVKDNAAKAFEKIKDVGSKSLSKAGNYLSNSFAPLAKGFTRSMESGAGVFQSVSRGITSQYMSITKGKPISEIARGVFDQVKSSGSKAFSYMSSKIPQSVKDNAAKAFGKIRDVGGKALSNVGNYLSNSFAPLTKGFTRSMESGAGVFQSVSRGITSQYMSITKGKPISEIARGAFDQVKNNGAKAFSYISSNIPQSVKDNAAKAFSAVSGYASKSFSSMSGFFSSAFAPLTKGFTKSMEAGEGVFKSLSRGITSQFMSITKGKPISEIASNAFSSIKEYGKKGVSLAGGALKGLREKAKGGLKTAGNAIGSLLPKKSEGSTGAVGASTAISPVENVKKVGEAGDSVKGNFEKVKEALKNLAEGLKSFANKESFLGALNLIPTSIGLTAMVPGFLGAKLVEKIEGKKVAESLGGLAEGLKSMASGKVLLGAGAILLSSIGLLALLPALPGLAILGAISGLVTSGLTALSTGLTTFGTAAANPMMWLGILAIGALGVALIPLGYALSTLSPIIVAFGAAVGTVLGGISGIIVSVAEGMTNFLGAVSLEKAAGLAGIAGGLALLSAAVIAFSVATAAAGWVSFFGGNSKTLDGITRLADAGPNLNIFADSLAIITGGLKDFESSLASVDFIEDNIERLINVALKLATAAPAIQAVSGALNGMPGMSIKESHLESVNSAPAVSGSSPLGPAQGSVVTTGNGSISAASPAAANNANVEQKLIKDKASLSPVKSEVVSPELNALTSETEAQTDILNEMKGLFEQFIELMKPKSQPNTSGGGIQGSTQPNTVVGKPTNYYRRVAGNIAQNPGRSTVNLGAKAVS